jgi:hypothetical protein
LNKDGFSGAAADVAVEATAAGVVMGVGAAMIPLLGKISNFCSFYYNIILKKGQ